MLEQQTREGEVVSSNPAGRVSREFSAKNVPTSMKTDGRWLVAASPEKSFAIIFGFFSHFHFAECKSLPINFLSSALCRVWHSEKPLPSVFRALPSAASTRQREGDR